MPTLVFPSPEVLRLVLTSGLVPAEVQAAPARVLSPGTGALRITPDVSLGRAAVKALEELGIRQEKTGADAGTAVSCWAELVPLGRTPGLDVPGGPVLFQPADERELLSLAGELLRLGCERQELCLSGRGTQRRALLRAVAPPYFTLTRALDRVAGLRAFVPAVAGQQAVWLELGHTHPLVRTLRAPVGALLLLPGQGGWMTAPDGPWRDLSQFVDLQLPESGEDWAPLPAPGRLTVPLRLSRAARVEAASLWVLRENAVAQVEALVNSVPEAVLARLRFAVSGPPEAPRIVLRARPGRERPPELGLEGTAYAPLPQLPQLYLPCDARLEPPLSGERLRSLFASEAEAVTWLLPTGSGGFRAERLPESAFQPLEGWVDYVLDTAAVALEPWVRGATFDFEDFRATGPSSSHEAPTAEPEKPARRRSVRREPAVVAPPPPPRPPPAPVPEGRPMRLVPLTRAQITQAERTLSEIEAEFLALESPAEAPERLPRWERMAELHGQLGRSRDAGLCWTRALWESSGGEARRLAARWAEAVAAGASPAERLLLAAPSEDDVRALASQAVLALYVPGVPLDVPAVQRWLDRHDGVLDVRAHWLARAALARLSGGDELGMAQAADRVLALLHRGLSRSRDVPTFLRSSGEASHAPRLRVQLDALLERFERAPRRRSPLEAPLVLTQAYVRLLFAGGYARLGLADRARELMSLATLVLDAKDAVHGYLVRALSARVAQALEGQPAATPLPDVLAAEYAALGTFARYKVDRLRQASSILEPDEKLDPTRGYARSVGGDRDEVDRIAAALRDPRNPARFHQYVENLVHRAVETGMEGMDRQRLFDLLLDTLPRLPPARALPLLTQMVPALAQFPDEAHAKLLGEALGVAGHFGREDHVRTLVGQLRVLFEGLKPEAEAWRHGILGTCLRDLRRLGLTREVTELLEPGQRLLARSEGVPLATQLGIAAGLAQLGHLPEATAVFDRAFRALESFAGPLPERLGVVRGLAMALSQAPIDVALPGLARLSDQFPEVTDGYNTNSHFCLSVLELADALVLGHVGVGQGTGERERRWLDEDEFLVRRRIHRELEEQS